MEGNKRLILLSNIVLCLYILNKWFLSGIDIGIDIIR